jgi:spore germination cell wall hydrolase CwlJ-like protein
MHLNKPLTGTATHYHTDYVDPVWNKHLVQTRTIGTHIFYRFPRGQEWNNIRSSQERADRAT